MKAGQFYNVTQWLKQLRSGSHTYIPSGGYHSLPSSSRHDPNTMDVDAIRLSPAQRAEHMHNNKCFICHKVGCRTDKHPHPGNKSKTRPFPTSSSSFTCAAVFSKATPLLNYARKLNITKEEAISSLGIVYGELNQDGTPTKSLNSESVASVNQDFL